MNPWAPQSGVYIVDIEPWGKLESKDLNVAIQFAKTSVTNGFELGAARLVRKFSKFLNSKKETKHLKRLENPPTANRVPRSPKPNRKAAGMALSARRGDTSGRASLKGAALTLYHKEITTKELKNLAKLGQKVKQHKSKEPKHLKSLPGHATAYKGLKMLITKRLLVEIINQELCGSFWYSLCWLQTR